MKRTQQGFTLIELMIVVAIIGILAAVAIPAYKDYIARTQATEGSVLLSGLKAPVAEFFNDQADLPAPGAINAVVDGKYVDSITGGGGPTSTLYVATFKTSGIAPQLTGRTMTLAFITSTGKFRWSCSEIEQNIRPKNCK